MTTDERSATDPRPLRADARRNRRRVLAAAREAFTEHGTEATMDDIARRAEVGPGTLYRHFPTREALLADVYRGDVDALAEQARQLAHERPPEEALHAWLRLQLEYIRNKRGLGAAVKTILGAQSEMLVGCRDIMRAALGQLLAGAQEAGVVRTDVEAAEVLRLVHGVVLASETAPDEADRLLSIVLDGLRPRNG
jgi:AcrR family transcriptional regulator